MTTTQATNGSKAMTREQNQRLADLLAFYVGWGIEERKPGRWVAVDQYDRRVISGTLADSLEKCRELTLVAAECAAAVVSEQMSTKPLV